MVRKSCTLFLVFSLLVSVAFAEVGYKMRHNPQTGRGDWVIDETTLPAGGGTPGGSDKQLQYNDDSSFGGIPGTEYTKASGDFVWSIDDFTFSDMASFLIDVPIQFGDANTYITKDISGNLSFTDAVTGTLSLAELAAALDPESDMYGFNGAAWEYIGSTSNALDINIASGNISGFALETGGNLSGAATSLAVMDDWDDVDRAKTSYRLILSAIDDTTVDSTADLIFDASADTDAVRLSITNVYSTPLFVGEDASVTTTDFMFYIPPYQHVIIDHAGNAATTEDLYGIRAAGGSGACKVYSWKYK